MHRATPSRLIGWLETLAQDLRYACRTLARQPSFSAAALFALVLAIGLNTSLFAAINAVWTRPLAVPEPDDVVNVYADDGRLGLSLSAVRFLDENSRSVESVIASRAHVTQPADGVPSLGAEFVTADYFDTLRVGMTLGRGFLAEENVAGSPIAVAVVSHELWTRQFGAEPSALGRTIRVDGVPFTVVGVAASTFGGTGANGTDLWLPYAAYPAVMGNAPTSVSLLSDPNRCCSNAAARLRPGVAPGEAQAELTALYRQWSQQVGREPADVFVTGTAPLDHPELKRRLAPLLAIVVVVFASVLLLACANVSNLLLARATQRQREIAVRPAIGAARARVVRQLLTESVLLAGIASAIGLALAYVLPDAFARFIGRAIPGNLDVTPDGHVLAYAVGIALASAAAFGLLPALRGTRVGVSGALKVQGAHASARAPLRGALLALQVAVSVALLMSAALLVRGLDRARSLDVGFQTEGVTAVRVTLPPNTYDLAREAAFYDELVAAAGEPAAVSLLMPLGGRWEATGFDRFGDVSCNTERIVTQRVSRGFFDVLGIPLVAGTTFAAGPLGRNSLVIDESLARACWPGESAVGRVVTFGDTTREIVGVARDAHLTGVGTVYPTYYAPFVPDGDLVRGPAFVLVRNESAAAAAAAVRRLDAAAVAEALPLEAEAERSLAGTADIARIASALGLVALVLATVGVYGVVSYSVEQRRHELGIRIALGARPDQVARHVLRANGAAIAIGLAVGLAIAAAASLLLRSRLYGLSPLDPVAYAGVLGLLAIAGAVASIVPARRAARTDPIVTLHED